LLSVTRGSNQMYRAVLITGASSGIGKALALHYAGPGVCLALIGRDQSRLDRVAQECRELGARVSCAAIDVRRRNELTTWITAFDRDTAIELLIANAGLMAGTRPGGGVEPPDAGYEVVRTNVLGVLNTVQPLLEPLMARRRGQIAIVSSIAAFLPLPDAPSYCASKSALLSYGLSLRALMAPDGVGVSVICPGYVETPMTQRESGTKPFMMAPDRAAALIAAGLARNQAVIAFPSVLAWATRLHGLLPDKLRRLLLRRARFTVTDDR
jgi:short-subunit dehydrogenase